MSDPKTIDITPTPEGLRRMKVMKEVIPHESADFHTQIEEYAELEDGTHIQILG